MNILQKEPTRLIGLFRAALLVAVAFGLPLSDGQTQALIGLAVAGLAMGEVNRAVVTPVAKVEEIAKDVGGNALKLADRITGRTKDEDGGVPLAIIILMVVAFLIVAGLFTSCDALFEDEDEKNDLGMSALVLDHDGYDERDRCYGYECREGGSGDEGEYRDDNRRAGISPGPFDRSPVDFRDNRVTICFPFASCRQDDEPPPEDSRGSSPI